MVAAKRMLIATARWAFWIASTLILMGLAMIFRLLPVEIASSLGGGVAGLLGAITPWHRRNVFNIGYAMPETDMQTRRAISRASFINAGRIAGEFMHTGRIIESDRITIEGLDMLAAHKGGAFIIGAHMGNWEILTAPSLRLGRELHSISRAVNNPPLAKFMAAVRPKALYGKLYPKGPEGARGLIESVAAGKHFGMLVDQKLREGMMLPFFGHKASTATTHIRIALRNDVPIFMVQMIRKPRCRFVIKITRLQLPKIKNKSEITDALIARIGTEINAIIEGWIRENPGQWLWTHRRWPASKGEVENP